MHMFSNEWKRLNIKHSCLISDNMERLPQRQVSLNKFIRLAGDLLMPSLYSPYVQLLVNLCGHPEAALHCFNLLKLNGGLTGKSICIKWIFSLSLASRLNNGHFFMEIIIFSYDFLIYQTLWAVKVNCEIQEIW